MADEIIKIEMLEGSAKEWSLKQEEMIQKEFLTWLFLILLSFIIPALLMIFRVEPETAYSWFQRSGSIIVALALLAEIGVMKIDRMIIARDHSFLLCHKYIEQKFTFQLEVIKYSTYFVIAVGTVIWGYGDLLLLVIL